MKTEQNARTVRFLDLGAQYRTCADEIDAAIRSVISTSSFILGGALSEFEGRFAEYVGARRCVGVSSGLEALRMILEAIGIGAGDRVILPANTFIATAFAVTRCGAVPVFVDVEEGTWNMDPEKIKSAVAPKTKAIVAVHLYGRPANFGAIKEVAGKHNIPVIEDAAQAHGARFNGLGCGSLGLAAAFSFYPGKNLGAYGDGGAITTNDDALADMIARVRNYGQTAKYFHTELGGNFRLDTIQAAILNVKLEYLERWNQRRREFASLYRERLQHLDHVRLPAPPSPGVTEVHHLFVIHVEDRDSLRDCLLEKGIETGLHYPVPIHLQPCYAGLGYRKGDFPIAEASSRCLLSLPIDPMLSNDQIEYVCEMIKDYYQQR